MLIECSTIDYKKLFPVNPNPFITEDFLELNKKKTEGLFRLINDTDKPSLGLVAGLKNGILKSPFSAPFGGFHFKNSNVYISEIDEFLKSLQLFITSHKLDGFELTLPPSIYHETFNAKAISSLIRTGFHTTVPEITNWIDLYSFREEFNQKNSREYYRQSIRNGLNFEFAESTPEKKEVYELIRQNRAKFGRPIYMTFDDIMNTGLLWPVDFFKVTDPEKSIVASAIFYRCHPTIAYAVFWGDNEAGRPLRAMDFLAFHLWSHYKKAGYNYIDLGISTESGNPNEGLLRFKESHNGISSLRYAFSWHAV
jgi:hypothetical protein